MDKQHSMGQRIQELRKRKGLTQTELAKEIHVSMAAIRNYENNLREPNSKAMAALERYFGVSGEYLRGETDWDICISEYNTGSDENGGLSRTLQVLWPVLNRAPAEQRFLAESILTDVMSIMSGSLLQPDSPNDIDGDKIVRVFHAAFLLNANGLTELDKRAAELTQLEQYRK